MQNTAASSVEPVTLHGFTIYPYGPLSADFRSALKRLADRGYCDPGCPVVKTASGKFSGITHAGGRYIDPGHHVTLEILELMRAMGMPLPKPPCVVAPGPKVLFHEWGHRVDRRWTPEHQGVNFSFLWFSHFYRVSAAPFEDFAWLPDPEEDHATKLLPHWALTASELWADLFEDWMRGDKRVAWDNCKPEYMRRQSGLKVEVLPGITVAQVRAETYQLFGRGFEPAPDQPEVRPDFVGEHTATALGHVNATLRRIAVETGIRLRLDSGAG